MASYPLFRRSIELPAAFRRGTKLYDLSMGAPLILFYGLNGMGRLRALHDSLSRLDLRSLDYTQAISILSNASLLIVALLFVICVTLRPPPIARAPGLMPRIAALVGTYLAVALLLFSSKTPSGWITSVSTVMVLCGASISAYAVFYLGRSVSLMAEARKLVTGGPYGYVRHPLYFGEEIAIAGCILQYFSAVAVLVFAIQLSFQFYRMACEEKVLADTFPEYSDYARRTNRILPGLY